MIGILIGAFVLMAALYYVARHDAAMEFPRLVLVSLGIMMISALLSPIGIFATPILGFATAWILMRYCYVDWGQARLVTSIYLLTHMGLVLLLRG
jgi:hypothetical protein